MFVIDGIFTECEVKRVLPGGNVKRGVNLFIGFQSS